MAPDLRDLFPNVPQYQLDLYAAFLEASRSGNPLRVYRQDRRHGKSWILRWLRENEPLLKKSRERNSALPPRTTKEGTSISVQKSRQNTSAGSRYEFIIFDELTENPDDNPI